jgi:hypothetical protein
VRGERPAARPTGRLPRAAPRAWVSDDPPREAAEPVPRPPRTQRHIDDHRGGGAGLGPASRGRRLELVGLPAVGGARLCHLPPRGRPDARGARAGTAATTATSGQPVLVFRRRHRRADRRGTVAVHSAAARHARHPDRAARRDRDPGRGSDRAGPSRRRPRRRTAHRAVRQVRQSTRAALHASTVEALRGYQRLRRRHAPATGTPAFFVSLAGTRLRYCNVHHAFHRLVRLAGLTPRSPSCRPRVHDLRHSFAVRSMLDAYAAGEDGQARLTLLSTWLGHVHPASTYWYLSASPELLAVAGQRLEQHLAARSAARR